MRLKGETVSVSLETDSGGWENTRAQKLNERSWSSLGTDNRVVKTWGGVGNGWRGAMGEIKEGHL